MHVNMEKTNTQDTTHKPMIQANLNQPTEGYRWESGFLNWLDTESACKLKIKIDKMFI